MFTGTINVKIKILLNQTISKLLLVNNKLDIITQNAVYNAQCGRVETFVKEIYSPYGSKVHKIILDYSVDDHIQIFINNNELYRDTNDFSSGGAHEAYIELETNLFKNGNNTITVKNYNKNIAQCNNDYMFIHLKMTIIYN